MYWLFKGKTVLYYGYGKYSKPLKAFAKQKVININIFTYIFFLIEINTKIHIHETKLK